ncbi:MAG TPA: hypothetical protein VLU95_09155 [Candidatus Acidoferrum sp.]|nr:hypothetical protein [Candidatus Acidoferrum sp.]
MSLANKEGTATICIYAIRLAKVNNYGNGRYRRRRQLGIDGNIIENIMGSAQR